MSKGPIKYSLRHPFTWDEKEYTEIEMQRPKGKHIKKLGADPRLEDLLDVASKCSGIVPKVFDEMDAEDCLGIGGVIGDFLASGQEIGKTS